MQHDRNAFDETLGRRSFLALTSALGLGLGAAASAQENATTLPQTTAQQDAPSQSQRPNIVLIVADDLGYGDLSVQGCVDIKTPHIDSIAQDGVRFTQGYVSCPVCGPTRAGLMTGRYQQRFGYEYNDRTEGIDPAFGLPTSEVTLANVLKSAGYATGVVGKWHLGYEPQFHPQQRGFDEFFGFLGGSHTFTSLAPNGRFSIFRGTEAVDEKGHLTDLFAREATSFIDRHHASPFFLYVAFNAVHRPTEPDPAYLERFAHIGDDRRRGYAAQLAKMDDAVGSILDQLRTSGVDESTLVIFLSDNGGPTHTGALNTPLRSIKGTVYEGGIRVPFFARWKGHLPEGKAYTKPVISLDIFPTVAAAAQANLPADREIDGVNLIPFVTERNAAHPHEFLYWRYSDLNSGDQMAVRSAKWKYLKHGENLRLFNLEEDVSESEDLLATNPEASKQLLAAFAQWETNTVAPLWPPKKK